MIAIKADTLLLRPPAGNIRAETALEIYKNYISYVGLCCPLDTYHGSPPTHYVNEFIESLDVELALSKAIKELGDDADPEDLRMAVEAELWSEFKDKCSETFEKELPTLPDELAEYGLASVSEYTMHPGQRQYFNDKTPDAIENAKKFEALSPYKNMGLAFYVISGQIDAMSHYADYARDLPVPCDPDPIDAFLLLMENGDEGEESWLSSELEEIINSSGLFQDN